MATWLKAEIRLRTHPKTVMAGPAASWIWMCGNFYCREHLTDGFIPAAMLGSLVPGVSQRKCEKFAAVLVQVELWRAAEGGYQVHDFLDWNPSKADIKAEREADAERKRLTRGVREMSERTEADRPGGQIAESDVPCTRAHDSALLSTASAVVISSLEEGPGETISRPLISGQSKPMNWGKIHGNHVAGFCDWVCLPDFIFNEFAAKSGQLNAHAWTKNWALTVRRAWEGRPIGDDSFVFWRARWAEFLGTTKTNAAGAVDVLAGLR